MKEQQIISKQNLESKIGKIYEVLVEEKSFDGKYYIGRTKQDVPEIDGIVYVQNNKEINQNEILNQIIKCKIIDVSDYDLIGEGI